MIRITSLLLHNMKYVITVCCFVCFFITANAQNADTILGKWESVDKNLIVQVYKDGITYRAKIVWFSDKDDTTSPAEQRLDVKNPNKSLRSRKLIGLDILSGMVYNAKQHKYVNGKIYDSSSGKTWSAAAWLSDADILNVRGYYLVRLVGKTLNFTRI